MKGIASLRNVLSNVVGVWKTFLVDVTATLNALHDVLLSMRAASAVAGLLTVPTTAANVKAATAKEERNDIVFSWVL
jgi:hypothetical protein